MTAERLWECPECGRRFLNRGQWHSCDPRSLDDALAGASDHAVAIFEAIAAQVGDDGVRIHPQKTRIAFISAMTFASVKLARGWVDLSFITPEPIDDERIRRLDVYGPTSFDHGVRLAEAGELDADVRSWLGQARRRGARETVDERRKVAPLTGRPRVLARVFLPTTVLTSGGELGLALPAHAAALFAGHPGVTARIAGHDLDGRILDTGRGRALIVGADRLRELGLGEGDHVDVVLRASAEPGLLIAPAGDDPAD